jgi:hypothetical protein
VKAAPRCPAQKPAGPWCWQRHRIQAGTATETGGIVMPGPWSGVRRIEHPRG